MNLHLLLLVMAGGALGAGLLLIWLEGRGPMGTTLRAFLVVGLLGGLTTYSALMLESLLLARSGRLDALAGYLALTLAGGFAAVWLGARLGESWRGPLPG
ncbi:MAG: fluoride efflux transporter FluC [Silanimonas sp.]